MKYPSLSRWRIPLLQGNAAGLPGVFVLISCVLALAGCAATPVARPVAPHIGRVGHTGSMLPTFKGGEVIAVSPARIEDVHVGQVIVVWWEGRQLPVLHRVIAVTKVRGETVLIAKGDNNTVRDPHVCTRQNFIGVAEKLVAAAN